MEELLGIAAGAAPEVLAEQARRFGESEAQVLEAARFYAREVLFHPQADAYRVLGVDPQASADTIKGHYRLLQLWLHPDRTRSEDDVVFAARVNSAWNRLRSAERRRAYDDALRAARPPEIFDSSGALRSVRTWVPAAESVVPPSPWRRRWPALALLALCGVLALLALRDMERADAEWEASQVTPDAGHRREPEPIASLLPSPGADRGVQAAALADSAPGRERQRGKAAGQSASDGITDRRQRASASRTGVLHSNGWPASRQRRCRVRSAPASPAPSPTNLQLPQVGRKAFLPINTSRPFTQRPAAIGNQASVPTETSPASPSVVQPEFAKVESARLTGAQLLDYLRAPRRPAPPIWSSPAVETDAARLRQELHAEGRVRLGEAQWRIGSDNAVLESAVVVAGRAPRGGVLTARLRWRDGYWLVTGMDMESTR